MSSYTRDPLTGALALEPDLALELLRRVVSACHAGTVAAFDLDSTLLNNASRQARIMREYGLHASVKALGDVQASHWSGWDDAIPMRNVGLSEHEIATHSAPFKSFWRDRFFTSDYCTDDVPIEGAARFVQAVANAGAVICYVTGRHEPMRAGSAQSLVDGGFPPPGVGSTKLIMKPTLEESDDTYKERAYRELRSHGVVCCAFDNEPTHINGYARVFPEAISVHLATDHSMREIRVADGIPSIADFSMWR